MKKISLILSLMLSAFAFSNNNPESSSTMNIKARVLKPLTVSHSGDIDFGDMVPNSQSPRGQASFTIEGVPGEAFEFTLNGTKIDAFANSELTHTNGQSTLPFYTDNRVASNGNIWYPTLDHNGRFTLSFNYWTYASQGQTLGEYSGALLASVRYH